MKFSVALMPVLIKSDIDAFAIEDGCSHCVVAWASVSRIIAYKIDLFVVDEICIDVVVDTGKRCELDESMDGFSDFVENMERSLIGIEKEWWHKVAFPAFETCEIVVYDRA